MSDHLLNGAFKIPGHHLSMEATSRQLPRDRGLITIESNLIFILIFSIMPLIDSINGMMLRGGTSSFLTLGDVYRILIIICAAGFYCRRFSKGALVLLLLAMACGLCQIAIHAIAGINTNTASELNLLVQWLLAPFITISIYTAVRSETISRNSIRTVLDVLQWLAPFTILVPYVLGIGYSTYGSSDESLIGYKAFYYANNGISLMLIVLFTRAIFKMFKKRTLFWLLIALMNGVSLALIGTKSSLAMLVLAFFVAVYCIYGNRLLRLLGRLLPVICILYLAMYLTLDEITNFLSPVLARWDYFSTRVYSNDLLGALTSGRIYQIGAHWNELVSTHANPLALFVGLGDLSSRIRICEMDYFDMFFQFGIVGLAFLCAFIVFVLKRGYAASGRRGFSFCMTCFLLLYALVIGHVFNNAMSSMMFSLIAAMAMTEQSKDGCSPLETEGQ